MNVMKSPGSLTSLIKTMPIDEKSVESFRARALDALDHAVDVFFKPEREVAEGKQAYDQLADVESALRAYQGRLRKDAQATESHLAQVAKEWVAPESRTEPLENQPSILPHGEPIARGERTYHPATVAWPHRPDVATGQLEQLSRSLTRMGQVLPLYASVAMVPGPLSISLKDHLQQSMHWSSQSQSSSTQNFHQESVRLLTLSGGRKTAREASRSSSTGSGRSETVTVDERVMTGLQDIRNDLDGLGFVAAERGELKLQQGVTEYQTLTYTTGLFFKKTHQQSKRLNSGKLELRTKEVATAPAYIALGLEPDNTGLKARPGSDIVDLLAGAPELTPELLARFQDRGRELLDQAVTTLFQPDREVADGRKAYDGLTNLARSLRVADEKWSGDAKRYYQLEDGEIYASRLGFEAHQFEKATALFACVAMVPGEMSSSVKNFAKELATFQSSGSAASSNSGREVSGSLLTGRLSVTEETGGSQSSHSLEGRSETTTTDERIMPALHRLRGRLEELEIKLGRDGQTSFLNLPG